MRANWKKLHLMAGRAAVLCVVALGTTAAVAKGPDFKVNNPREAVPLQEVVLVSKDSNPAAEKVNALGNGDGSTCGCGGLLGSLLGGGGLLGNLLGTGNGGALLGGILGGTGGCGN
ncbi:hypothetical protein KRR26_28920 [Corallococcus sp. M34]|uniref:hypothetical protein n=1 Tax=Citreicoccus inhibens TaxID=2849499 RepID=UPI0018F45867|nr:hypothetical protein [Citreicoccus inhibens]MBU8899640.1 hypothetical protein [Citreicoccus inhibens]